MPRLGPVPNDELSSSARAMIKGGITAGLYDDGDEQAIDGPMIAAAPERIDQPASAMLEHAA